MKKYFYEKGDVLSWPCNITYGELVTYDDNKFYEWIEERRGREDGEGGLIMPCKPAFLPLVIRP